LAQKSDQRICVAEIGAPRGVRGEVRLRAFTEDPAALLAYGPLETTDGRKLIVLRLTPAKGAFVARIEGVETREAAEALKSARLYVPRGRLPPPGEGEWYHADLVGLVAFHVAGGEIGSVIAVQDFGAGDLLEIRLSGGRRTVLLPFTRAVVPVVDVTAGRIEIDPPEGLLNEEPDR
jgi:16S rRNA processing protein RimM